MVKVNAMGDACPIPVVKTKNAIKQLQQPGELEVLVDNEIAVQNLTKMANQKVPGCFIRNRSERFGCGRKGAGRGSLCDRCQRR